MTSIAIPLGSAILMFTVGLEIRAADFRALVAAPRVVALVLVAQILVLPPLAWGVATVFALPAPLAVGLVLVAAAPVGVTANFVTLAARGDVAPWWPIGAPGWWRGRSPRSGGSRPWSS